MTKGLIWGIIYSVKTIGTGDYVLNKNEALEKLAALTARIKELPKGYISKKTIGGKIYYYHQWSENGSKQSRYIKDDEVEPLAKQIAERKELQAQVSSLKSTSAKKSKRNLSVTKSGSTLFASCSNARNNTTKIAASLCPSSV